MSPSENDLRAALRDGEGDGVNVERIVTDGRARARRRTQVLNAAAITVVVAGIGAGLTFLGGSDDSKSSAANQGGASAQRQTALDRRSNAGVGRAPVAAGGGAASATPSAQAPASSTACPDTLPRYLLPPTASDAGGSLFGGPVSTVVVCAYGGDSAGQNPPTRVVLTGEDAKALVDSLEQSSARKPGGMCPDYRSADEQPVAVIGLDANGHRVGLVTTTLGRPACAVDVRNGKVVRYGWQPPRALTGKLALLVPKGGGMSHHPVGPSGSPTK